MNYSIKRFLLIFITLSILLIYGSISIVSYKVSKDELDELYDANLQQVANAVAAQHMAIHDVTHLYNNVQAGDASKIKGEEEFYVRVLAKDGSTLYVSHPIAIVPFPTNLGFSTEEDERKKWRIFSIKAKNETIQVAQSLRLRKNTINDTAFSLIYSQLVFIPLLVLLIFVAIRKALSPLQSLSDEIKQRKSSDLSPFQDSHIPVEIKPLLESLNLFMGKVASMVDILKRFTSDAAHELRTPITALKLQLSLVEQASSKSERDSAIQDLKEGINRSEQLVSQLLTLARIEPENRTRQLDKINLEKLVKKSIEDLLPLAQEKSIDLGLDCSKDYVVHGVEAEIKVLVNNIIDNSIRYTPNNGVVNVLLYKQEDNVILEVSDSGPGIPNDDFVRVFERFYRGDNKQINGSGLGLSIVKEIALQHQLGIELNNLHPGLSFKVIFTKQYK